MYISWLMGTFMCGCTGCIYCSNYLLSRRVIWIRLCWTFSSWFVESVTHEETVLALMLYFMKKSKQNGSNALWVMRNEINIRTDLIRFIVLNKEPHPRSCLLFLSSDFFLDVSKPFGITEIVVPLEGLLSVWNFNGTTAADTSGCGKTSFWAYSARGRKWSHSTWQL